MFKIQNPVLFIILVLNFSLIVYPNNKTNDDKSNVIVGANQISKYENLLQDKRIGIVANHTSVIFKKDLGHTHLVDSLIKSKSIFPVNISASVSVIFSPLVSNETAPPAPAALLVDPVAASLPLAVILPPPSKII